ncbi:YbaN family protein [Suttonella indologenes]|uniref:Inner membrane protein n=1 Tax=Suttonella indologenes TaxID=13276 RepID=A0A380MYF7_9GAMM|nr:YbaN family protein [Suttonella indologenes]SUO96721.1 Inner membrane protein ybaN [Suttonella indologenes]
MKTYSQKLLLKICGILALIAGIIGFALPVMPTTPFVILASWCFARSSPRFHQYLLNHKHFGEALQRWENHRQISRKAKWLSSSMMCLSIVSCSILLGVKFWWISAGVALICAAVIYYLWQLPEYQ